MAESNKQRDILEIFTEAIVQEMAYKISDLCESYNSGAQVFFLVAEQLHVNALLPVLGEKDCKLFDMLIRGATTAVLPMSMDPRKGRE